MRATTALLLGVALAGAACGRDGSPGESVAAGPTTTVAVVTTRPHPAVKPPVILPPTTVTTVALPACVTDVPTETAWVWEGYDFQATAPSTLWLAGYAAGGPATRPTVRSSSDGGSTWRPLCWPVTVTARGLAVMVRFRGQVGFMSGAAGPPGPFNLRTADGGETWEPADIPAPPGDRVWFRDAAFAGDDHVWLAGATNPGTGPMALPAAGTGSQGSLAALYRSTDGGKTFSPATHPPEVSIERVSFPDKDNGWAVAGGRLWSSADGGATWAAVHHSASFPDLLTGVWFVDASTGFVLGREANGSEGRGVLVATTDGGQTWERRLAEDDRNFRSVTFVDGQHGWVSGGHSMNIGTPAAGIQGVVYGTDDGGRTWELRAELTARDVQTLSFLDPLVGYATVVNRPCLLRTEDGGRNWTKQPLGGAGPSACEQK